MLTYQAEVIYDIPVTCSFKYIEQTGYCINLRLTEHKQNVKNKNKQSQPASPTQECGYWFVDWTEVSILVRAKDPKND